MLVTPSSSAEYSALWRDNVCMQSTMSSCGPASAATLLKAMGYAITERELARDSFTTRTGTEVWYLARALQRRGFTVRYRMTTGAPTPLPHPAIAGTWFAGSKGAGHFIAILDKTRDHYLIGDPLVGPTQIKLVDLHPYTFSGFFMVVTRGHK